jgi:hypothetical protein
MYADGISEYLASGKNFWVKSDRVVVVSSRKDLCE